MYHQIVRRIVRNGFEDINRAEFEKVLSQCVPNVTHIFPGTHALGGERHDVEALRQWFGRLGRLLPGFHMDVTDILVKGWPWNTTIVVQWTGRASLENGYQYLNYGVHFLTLRWGRLHKFHVYLNSQETAKMLDCLAQSGTAEAVAAPITS